MPAGFQEIHEEQRANPLVLLNLRVRTRLPAEFEAGQRVCSPSSTKVQLNERRMQLSPQTQRSYNPPCSLTQMVYLLDILSTDLCSSFSQVSTAVSRYPNPSRGRERSGEDSPASEAVFVAPWSLSPFTMLTPFPDRVQKIKDARTEASKEIEEYKKAKDAEFKAFEASVRSQSSPQAL